MEPDSFSDLYVEAPSDYALNALERLFGGIIPFLSGQDATFNDVGTVLSPMLGVVNMIILCIAVLLGAYTFLSLAADTASDGQVLGRSTDTKNTFIRAGLAALSFLPVNGVFSLIQLLGLGVGILGSGFANYGWTLYSRSTLDGTAYTSATEALSGGDWALRGKMGEATYTAVMGHLCKLHMDRLADTLNVAAQTIPMAVPRTSTFNEVSIWTGTSNNQGETKSFDWYYQTGAGADASNDVCGSIRYSISYKVPTTGSGPGASTTLFSFSENLATLAKNDVYNAVHETMRDVVLPRANALAERIYSGEPGNTNGGLRNTTVVQNEIRGIATDAALAIYNSRGGMSYDSASVEQIQEDLISAVTQSGWIMAPIWQRGMATLHTSMRELQSNLDLTVDPQHRIGSIFGTGIWGSWTAQNSVSQAAFQPVERDFEFLEGMIPFVDRLSLPDMGSQTNPIGADAGAEMGGQTVRAFYSMMIETMGPGAVDVSSFKDPFMQYTEMGANMFAIGAPLVAGGGIAEGVASVFGLDGIVGIVTGPVKAVGFYILAMGIAFMLIIPAIPILYFFSGVISWFALVVEAVFALPLALLMWLVPAREPSMIGPWNKVMVTLCGLLLRPIFLMVGLIACTLLLWVGNQILSIFFGNMLMVMTPGWSVMAIVMMFGLVGLYTYASVLLALHCSSLINYFGDAVMGWIGGLASPLNRDAIGESLAHASRNQVAIPGVHSLGQSAQQFGGGRGGNGVGNIAGNKISGALAKRRQDRLGG